MDRLHAVVRQIGAEVAALDLSDPAAAAAALDARVPAELLRDLSAELVRAIDSGALELRPAGPTIAFGRLARASDAGGCSVDVVDIEGAGTGHAHPTGEVSWCVPVSGVPEFEGCRGGWAVLPPGSHHVPTVRFGRMRIVYWVPGGRVTWDQAPSS